MVGELAEFLHIFISIVTLFTALIVPILTALAWRNAIQLKETMELTRTIEKQGNSAQTMLLDLTQRLAYAEGMLAGKLKEKEATLAKNAAADVISVAVEKIKTDAAKKVVDMQAAFDAGHEAGVAEQVATQAAVDAPKS